ncbi:MAG TPA: Gfo/Idh/MocA family oxidoreductase [Bryobacteraceae bacterium]|jgi:predicted dehydrogenase|nr:Gfo/Idh/MocA family oxidoreductase [Bryobacteraceae bacterium]
MRADQNVSRRQFLRGTSLAAAAGAFPLIVPSHVLGRPGKPGANDRIQVGIIGVGNRGNLLIDQLPEPGRIVAAADCFLQRCEDAAAKRNAKWDLYQDYRKLLDRRDIDAVIVATHDHGRVLPAIHACQAGKDVYAEKPLTLYIGEGKVLVKAARRYKTVFQVGSQQRSMEMNQESCALVRKGGLGKLKLVHGVNYPSSKPIPQLPDDPVPPKLDWDVWLGQAPMRAYNKKLQFGWMGWVDYSGGEMTNWGAHGLDQIQWALGMDGTGPVELWPLEGGPEGAIAFRYANGVTVHLDLPPGGDLMGGARFVGEKGSIDIWRNNFKIDAPGIKLDLPPQEEIDKWHDKRALWQAQYHMKYWLDCIPTRKTPNADVEIGHRSVSLGHLANITRRLNRKLRWDPAKERFPDDKEADLQANRPRRKGYELPKV